MQVHILSARVIFIHYLSIKLKTSVFSVPSVAKFDIRGQSKITRNSAIANVLDDFTLTPGFYRSCQCEVSVVLWYMPGLLKPPYTSHCTSS